MTSAATFRVALRAIVALGRVRAIVAMTSWAIISTCVDGKFGNV